MLCVRRRGGHPEPRRGRRISHFGFTGYYKHATSGLYLALYRAYNPALGRWISRDVLKDAEISQGTNLYSYVHNNPIVSLEPFGLDVIRYDDSLFSPNLMGIHVTTQIGGRLGTDDPVVGLYSRTVSPIGILGGPAVISDADTPNASSPDSNFRIYKTTPSVDAALWSWFQRQSYTRYLPGFSDCQAMSDDIITEMLQSMGEAGYGTIPYSDGYRRDGRAIFDGGVAAPFIPR